MQKIQIMYQRLKKLQVMSNSKLQKIIVTQGEIQDAMKGNVYRNKKKYRRKKKHKNKKDD